MAEHEEESTTYKTSDVRGSERLSCRCAPLTNKHGGCRKMCVLSQSQSALKVLVMPCVEINAEVTARALSISNLLRPAASTGLCPTLDHYGLSAAAGGTRCVSSEHGEKDEPRCQRR